MQGKFNWDRTHKQIRIGKGTFHRAVKITIWILFWKKSIIFCIERFEKFYSVFTRNENSFFKKAFRARLGMIFSKYFQWTGSKVVSPWVLH